MNPDERISYFAATDSRSSFVPFGIKAKDRSRHMYVIGKTGMGKSTLLENLAVQDIKNGEGITFIDPHGGTAEKLLDYIPPERVNDVLYFAPFDLDHPISFNVLEKVDADKRHLVVNGLMATFEKIWVDAWSARMAYILQNTLLALLEYPGATLLGVNRMYTDKEYRKAVVENITDPSVKSFWTEEYAKYTDRFASEATPAIQNKIGQFYSSAIVRNIIGQSESSFNLREIMDKKKIFIVNLSKGRVGEGNANLLGSMLITKIYLAAMSRADVQGSRQKDLPNHYLYVDEFQSFANRSFADILSEARKYKLALTIAHQYIEQMEEEVRAAVFGNVGTMIAFRVGSFDAEILEKEFAPIFLQEDIVNLGYTQIYLKLMIDGISSQPFSARTLPPIEEPHISYRDQAIEASRLQWAQPRKEVEEAIRLWHEPVVSESTKIKTEEKKERRDERRKEGEAGTLGVGATAVAQSSEMKNDPLPSTKVPRPLAPTAQKDTLRSKLSEMRENERTSESASVRKEEAILAPQPSPQREYPKVIPRAYAKPHQNTTSARTETRQSQGFRQQQGTEQKQEDKTEDMKTRDARASSDVYEKPKFIEKNFIRASGVETQREKEQRRALKEALMNLQAQKNTSEGITRTQNKTTPVGGIREKILRQSKQLPTGVSEAQAGREQLKNEAMRGEPHQLKREIPEDILKKLLDVDEKDLR